MATMSDCPEPGVLDAAVQGQLDPAARTQLDQHLDGCPHCAELLAELVHVFGSMMPSVAAGPQTRTLSEPGQVSSSEILRGGATLGRFRLGRAIGAGGMGVVYEAHDPQLQRRVALKLLHTEASAEVLRAQLLREARALARLSHPNVVSVHEVGEAHDQVYVAMEFIEGQTLRQWLRDNPSRKDILATFEQAGRGLEAAHAVGLVHRDFKPDNVLVGRDGRARVVDFGLARPLLGMPSGSAAADAASLTMSLGSTRPGSLVGTPAYMAPEQLRGEPADARSDQFAFCIALHEALVGVRPFAGGSMHDLARNVLASRRVQAPRLPRRLRKVVDRGLQRDPARRFGSMAELLAGLREGPRRLPAIVAASGLAAVAATALTWSTVRPSGDVVAVRPLIPAMGALHAQPEAEAEPQAPRAEAPAAVCTRSSAALWNDGRRGTVRAGIDAHLFQRDTSAKTVAALDRWLEARTRAVDEVCKTPGESPSARCLGHLDTQFDALATALGDGDESAAVHAQQAVARLIDPALCAEPAMHESFVESQGASKRGRRVSETIARARALTWLSSPQSEAAGRKAVEDADVGPDADARSSAAAHRVLGEALANRGKYVEAEAALREVLAEGAEHDRVEAMLSLLEVAAWRRRFDDVDDWRAAVRGAVDARSDAALGRRLSLTLARVDMARLDYDDARSTLGGLLREMTGSLGETHVTLLEPLSLAAELELLAENTDAARGHVERARSIVETSLPRGDLRGARVLALEGRIALATGDAEAAVTKLTLARKDTNHPRSAAEDEARIEIGIARAQAFIAAGREHEEIEAAFEDAWQVWPKRFANARVRHAQATWLAGTGDLDGSLQGHVDGVEVATTYCGTKDDPRLLEGLGTLARARLRAEHVDEAEATIKQAVAILDASIEYGPLWAPVYALRGELALAREQPTEALEAFDDQYVPMVSTWGVGHARVQANVLARADVAWSLKQHDYAKRLYGNVADELEQRLGAEHEDVVRAKSRADD